VLYKLFFFIIFFTAGSKDSQGLKNKVRTKLE